MMTRLQLAKAAVERRDLISNDARRYYGQGYLGGFKEALELASEHIKNSWKNPKYEAMLIENAISEIADDILQIGEDQLPHPKG